MTPALGALSVLDWIGVLALALVVGGIVAALVGLLKAETARLVAGALAVVLGAAVVFVGPGLDRTVASVGTLAAIVSGWFH